MTNDLVIRMVGVIVGMTSIAVHDISVRALVNPYSMVDPGFFDASRFDRDVICFGAIPTAAVTLAAKSWLI
jgi:hypothetical protein